MRLRSRRSTLGSLPGIARSPLAGCQPSARSQAMKRKGRRVCQCRRQQVGPGRRGPRRVPLGDQPFSYDQSRRRGGLAPRQNELPTMSRPINDTNPPQGAAFDESSCAEWVRRLQAGTASSRQDTQRIDRTSVTRSIRPTPTSVGGVAVAGGSRATIFLHSVRRIFAARKRLWKGIGKACR